MKQRLSLRGIWEVLVASCNGFLENKVAKLSGSLAYYTLFSMIPLLMVAIFICGIVLGKEATEGEIFGQLEGLMGKDTALQIQELIKNASLEGKNNLATGISVITLVIGATTVFAEIQDSINSIWGLKPKPKKEWLKLVQDRLLSFSVVISLGFILLVSLALSAIIEGFSDRLQAIYPEAAVVAFFVVNHTVTLVLSIIIFAAIFKVLPDAKIKWRDVIAGSVITSLLFMLGRFAISYYISKSNVGGIYGTAGSLVIVLLWTYYSSMILYFGAEFTKAYAMHFGSKIYPSDFAVTIKIVEIETGHASVQDVENKHIVVKEE
jgi:membrane protein